MGQLEIKKANNAGYYAASIIDLAKIFFEADVQKDSLIGYINKFKELTFKDVLSDPIAQIVAPVLIKFFQEGHALDNEDHIKKLSSKLKNLKRRMKKARELYSHFNDRTRDKIPGPAPVEP